MKLHCIKSPLIMMLAFSITMISCLKDKAYENGEIQSVHGPETKVVGLVLTASNVSNVLSLAVNSSDNDTVVNLIPVTLATHDPAPEDIHVTLTPDTTLIDQYNTDNGTSLTPATNFTLLNAGGVVVIPKGSNTGYLQIKFKPNDYVGLSPALAYKITNIAESGYVISGNASTGLASINIKNKYDADYYLRIRTTGWAAYNVADNVTNDWGSPGQGNSVALVTTGATTVKLFDYSAFNDFIQVAFIGGGQSGFGATAPQFAFDPATDKLVSVTNTATPDARNRAFRINPAITDSRFDPNTKTVYAAYIMSQNGRPDQFIYDTLTYQSPRK